MSYFLLLWNGLQFLQKVLGVPGRQLRDPNQKPASASALKPPLKGGLQSCLALRGCPPFPRTSQPIF